ncbi:LytTR family transcriptional regulator [Spirosoma sp. BT702]|uniref:LytTR family transcriptional regulator n=1 Tax=Spirosoma profusum TaxID=2771354 RepID=A0A927AMN5_9BACT|nr:LytTR family DNA-binding domain-containing protein [Spirosoma profusum]MBD2700169.1 LytTR family transcriptional regulator [Spirosoma profusum]
MFTALPFDNQLESYPPLRIYTPDGRAWLPLTHIIYLEGSANYTWLHTVMAQPFLVAYTLKCFEDQLPPTYFLRIHRHYLVNRRFIAQIDSYGKQGEVCLTTGHRLIVSRRRFSWLKQLPFFEHL